MSLCHPIASDSLCRTRTRDILIVEALASGAVTPLTAASDPAVSEGVPAWSPDASEIAFVRGQLWATRGHSRGSCDIYVVPATGGDPRPLEGRERRPLQLLPRLFPRRPVDSVTRHITGSTTYSAPEAEILLRPR